MKQTLSRRPIRPALTAVSMLCLLAGCTGYGRIDDYSMGYVPGSDGLYARLVSVVDAKTESEMKTDYRSTGDSTAVHAKKPLRAVLGCGRRSGGIGSALTTREILVSLREDARLSYVAWTPDSASACEILINLQDADGHYRFQEFERQLVDTVEGREIYTYVPYKKADAPAP